MRALSYIESGIYLLLILVLLKQYLVMWVTLDRLGLRILKYILPIVEITALIFMDKLFLFLSTMVFLILIYKGRILSDEVFKAYYNLEKEKFLIKPKVLLSITFIAPILFYVAKELNGIALHLLSLINIELYPRLSSEGIENNKQLIDYLTLFGVTCIIAPIVEEFTFRVLIYRNWLAKIFNKRIVALLASSLIFSLSHFDISTVIYTFITGIILGFIYDGFGYTGGVLLHMIFNSYGFIQVLHGSTEISTIIYISLALGAIAIFFSATKNKSIIKRV